MLKRTRPRRRRKASTCSRCILSIRSDADGAYQNWWAATEAAASGSPVGYPVPFFEIGGGSAVGKHRQNRDPEPRASEDLEGHTAAGIPCHAYVTRIAVSESVDSSELKRELQEHRPPSAEIAAIPLRLVL